MRQPHVRLEEPPVKDRVTETPVWNSCGAGRPLYWYEPSNDELGQRRATVGVVSGDRRR